MKKRISSFDKEYRPGDLSVFPQARDSELSLYKASNNTKTNLRHSITPTSKYLIVSDTSNFPPSGILRISSPSGIGNAEIVYYGSKVKNQFHDLQRGFCGHPRFGWPANSLVSYPVMAEHHNAIKDAIIKIQQKIGLASNPTGDSLSNTIKSLEDRWLSPKAAFRAWPKSGAGPLSVKFQNMSGGSSVRFLWDFGDGNTSTEKNPTHVYQTEGNYTVKLSIASSQGSQAVIEKTDYISVNDLQQLPILYARPLQGTSVITASEQSVSPTNFEFVDQTDGDIVERHWFFGDETDATVHDPNQHTIKHQYHDPGTYKPSLMIRMSNNQLIRANNIEEIFVI